MRSGNSGEFEGVGFASCPPCLEACLGHRTWEEVHREIQGAEQGHSDSKHLAPEKRYLVTSARLAA